MAGRARPEAAAATPKSVHKSKLLHRWRQQTAERLSTVQFATKIAVVLRDDLAVWQKANVTAFLVSGIAGTDPDTVGVPYADASGNRYLPMFREPVLVYVADAPGLRRAYERAMQRDVELAIYTQ